jgi:hypothetical protein
MHFYFCWVSVSHMLNNKGRPVTEYRVWLVQDDSSKKC